MTVAQNTPELPEIFLILDEKIKMMEALEKEYHQLFTVHIEEYINKNVGLNLRRKELTSEIIACTNGIFVIREANKHNSNFISTIRFPNTVLAARKEFKFNKLEHVRISNKIQFYALDYLDYDQIDDYDVKLEVQKDFQILVSNDNLVDDKYIRTVADVIELGINADFERGQFIFRGQINDEWELIPKLFRDYPEDAELIEIALCETLLLGIKNPYLNTYDPVDLLMNLQHFGIPTRLLDWTSDLLVALFFACYDEKGEFANKDGNLYVIEREQYTPFKVNSSENNSLISPINKLTIDVFKNRLQIDDIHIFEPVIKNPRLRIQDGCFMFFPFLPISLDEKKYVTLHDYMRAKNKYREHEEASIQNPISKIWIGNKKVDKNFKNSILQELNEKHGISKKTLFVEINHIESVSIYYKQLFEKAKTKADWIKVRREN